MDPYRNPFAPGAGSRPPELAGRDDIVEQARIASARVLRGRAARSIMLLGLRGTGKTVLLNELARIARDEGHLISQIEAPEETELGTLLVPEMRKVMLSLSTSEAAKDMASRALMGLRNFASVFKIKVAGVGVDVTPVLGLADSGDLEFDLPDLFVAIGEAAQAAGKGWTLFIDEVQYLPASDLAALVVAMHKVAQRSLPVIFMGAGLPQVARLAGDAKSYAE
ncbi:MAG: ATP-binding protein, partial [Pseudomonadota bacterium]